MNYNGWKNRTTWLVNLHINNEEETYRAARELKDADALQEWFEDGAYEAMDALPSVLWDLLSQELREVDWEEIYNGLQE